MPYSTLSRQDRKSRFVNLVIAALLAASFAAGCSGSHTGTAHYTRIVTLSDSYTPDGVTTRSVIYNTASTTLQITFSTPQSDYPLGTSIPLNLTITNVGTGTYTYGYCGLPAYANASPKPIDGLAGAVWDSTYDQAIDTVCVTGLTLAPGQSVSDQVIWKQNNLDNQPVGANTYAVAFVSSRLPASESAAAIPVLYISVGDVNGN